MSQHPPTNASEFDATVSVNILYSFARITLSQGFTHLFKNKNDYFMLSKIQMSLDKNHSILQFKI